MPKKEFKGISFKSQSPHSRYIHFEGVDRHTSGGGGGGGLRNDVVVAGVW